MKKWIALSGTLMVLLLTGCAQPKKPYDYTAFRASKPASILVLPAANTSPDINAAHSLNSLVTRPLAEAGYYVFPVAVVEETFQQNGLTSGSDAQAVSAKRLNEIFHADSALYISISDYGSSYRVIDSVTTVTAKARLVDLRSGKEIWQGSATATDNDQGNNNNNGVIGILVSAAIKQISDNVTDKAHTVAGLTSNRLLAQNEQGGLLTGPRYKVVSAR
ncbi:hypothetical protein F3I27_13745 [Pantoea sp. Bo_2]|uniref:DUF799 domain-containing protein n=1 Tax=unclassified Pantoea TaxID=2630326 RepID=UPI001231DDAD|nr:MULTISPECIES: DUF799 domain-containing protein [unclassified Pantoea]KAA5945008.1 hypothetical protein F3I57_11475 [Pantoea sp. VH_3]KAA5954868.1 hypothetical protein F3I55_13580 [Pantoea sp. VH_24]KAA5956984.1 hypothetical protein F3I56_01180 [Pantoea sp. VH_25]KAA5958531.1 hypothetical protein F3I53_14635 [Pantoea sp. VH_16]KAA5963948.1 hypothetical protein F3I54_14260 [Pantoea sp. VH_18]